MQALAAFGLAAAIQKPLQTDIFCLWPCNIVAWQIFMAIQTQWRVGPNGPTGLDYTAVHAVMQIRGIGSKKLALVFDQICRMESATLDVWADQAKNRSSHN